jgi:two-component system sensor histidine kinase/response regulator
MEHQLQPLTEVEQLRNALQRCQQQQALLFETLDASEDGVVAFRFDDDAVVCNRAFVSMWGIPEDALSGMAREQVFALQVAQVDDPEDIVQPAAASDAGGEDFRIVPLRDGRLLERHMHTQHALGRAVGCVIHYRDVTQRQQFEQKMMFNHVVVENSGPMLWVDAGTGLLAYANRAACEHLGRALHELAGRSMDEIGEPGAPAMLATFAQEWGRTGKPVHFEHAFRRSNGNVRLADVIGTMAEDGQRSLCILSYQDTTEQRSASRASRRQQALLSALVNSIPDIIVYKDQEGRPLGHNDAFAALATVPAAWSEDGELLSASEGVRTEDWVTYPDGTQALIDMVRSPLRDAEGKPMGILAVGRNVTQQRFQQEEVQRAKEMAEEATRMKSDFLANMSHEIRTPMNAIIGLSHLTLLTELTPHQRDYIGKVESSGQHLLGIINDILDFSKVEAGKLAIEREEFDIGKVLEQVAGVVNGKAAAKGLKMVFDVAPEVPRRLLGDSLRIGQILINYANNAVKYTDQGEVVIAVRMLESTGGEALLKLSVSDTGVGLTGPQLDRLFQSFSQADSSITRKYGGTGLGLAISKKLAHLMGGEVGVRSRLGAGSTFWFTLRAGIAAGHAPVAMPVALPAAGQQDVLTTLRGARILLVEDNDINQIVASGLLRDAGMRVDVADNGQIALQMMQAARYDLVLMDMQMPVMDGVTATREIRKQAAGAAVPIVAMTANAMQRHRDACVDAGMDDYLTKPVDPQELRAILRKWLRPEADTVPAATQGEAAACMDQDGMPQVPGLNAAGALGRMMGRKPLYLSMLRRWRDTEGDSVMELRAALAEGDPVAAERLAYRARSLAANIGADDLAAQAGMLEGLLHKRGSPVETERQLQVYATGLQKLMGGVTQALAC